MSELQHYGTPRHSGRYPWGSGKNPQRNKNFVTYVHEMKKKGMSESDIAKALIGPNANSSDLRAQMAISTNEYRKERMDRAIKLREKGYGPTKIGQIMGENESTIRSWLKGQDTKKKNTIFEISDILRRQVEEKKYVDVGSGSELSLNIPANKMNDAIAILKQEGYKTINVQVNQSGTADGMKTTIKVLAPPGTTYKDVNMHKDLIKTIETYEPADDREVSRFGLPPVNSISSDRLKIIYAEDGGTSKDGVIELRRGLTDLNLGNANYAQVRIGVDGKYYLKGMAVYSDNMPPGVDVIFNTNKSNTKPMQDVLKEMKIDPNTGEVDRENPFGASIKDKTRLERVPRYYTDENGKEQVSPVNVVSEEGDWNKWKNKLAAQMLSKQPNALVKKHLEISYDIQRTDFEEICAVENAVVKRKLLEQFASDCDSKAVHLRAAALPRQSSYVILPVPELKENEIFAPRYENGEQVALVRFPHGGTFEIPVLTVNNKNKSALSVIGNDAPDAVGIHPKAAVQLSGADFDGDTVLVIPTGGDIKIKARPKLKELEGFDEQKDALYSISKSDPRYKTYPFIEKGSTQEQKQMGVISNLITDMTLKGASDEELARAVKHSMVIIDAAKHHLDYKKSYKDNKIDELKRIYQQQPDGKVGGVSTLISRAKSEVRDIPRRDPDKKGTGNDKGWDPETGEIRYVTKKGDTYPEIKKVKVKDPVTGKMVNKKILVEDPNTGEMVEKNEWKATGKYKTRHTTSTQMAEANTPEKVRALISDFNTPNERAYADYAIKLKSLANEARKEYLATKEPDRDPEAARAYAAEVASLNSKLNIALKNAPRERQAQIYADTSMEILKQKKAKEHTELTKKEEGKYRAQALAAGRVRFNAKKDPVTFTEREWEAVQARAISKTTLKSLLNNANIDDVMKLALPKQSKALRPAQEALAKSMKARGYTLKEIAQHFGVSSSTISNIIS